MSYDEARRGFQYDAPDTIATNYYLLVGDNAYGYSTRGTNLSIPSIGDLDTYAIVLGVGTNYTIVSTGASLFGGPAVAADNFALLNRNGTVLALSSSIGSGFSAFTFTATDTLYYIQNYSSNAGYYGLRLANNSITEANGIGEVITAGQTYNAALDYVSDVDIYTFYAVAGVTYRAALVSSISDVFLDVEFNNLAVDNLVASGNGIYTFTAAVSGVFNLHISSNFYVNTGAYTLITDVYNSSSYSSLISDISSIATTTDGQYLLLKIGGVIYKAATDSTLTFSDGSVTTGSLVTQYGSKIAPIFMSSGGVDGYTLPELFTGPTSLNLQYQLIETADNAVVIGGASNDFIKVASANSIGKAVDGGGGSDVIDGGVGSTFITGGAGGDTFFLDGRAPGVSWSTITDFNTGTDKATIWGFVKGVSSVDTSFTDPNNEGAGGIYNGLTLHFKNLLPSGQTSGTNSDLNSITLSGRTLADIGVSSLQDLNNQINQVTTANQYGQYIINDHLIIGQTQDAQGTHGYLFVY